MKKTISLFIAIYCLSIAWGIPDAQAIRVVTRDMVQKEIVTRTDLIKTADNFIVMFDSSSSSNQMVPGRNISRIQATKDLLKERNAWFPDLGYQAGLYLFTGFETAAGAFKEIYGMQPYNREKFAAAIDKLPDKGQGPTMLQPALTGLRKTLAGLSGKTAVIWFTDGAFSDFSGYKPPLQIAQELARDHDVCFYMISSASASENEKLLESVSKVNACSRVVPLDVFLDRPTYLSGALFTVRTTSYVRLKPTTEVVGFIGEDMLFDFDSADIRSEYHAKLDKLGTYMQNNPAAIVIAVGFTDSTGEEEYNLALSERRAQSVKDYLMKNFGIDEDRTVTFWYGNLNPVGDNATSEGRRLNRRVEIAVSTGK